MTSALKTMILGDGQSLTKEQKKLLAASINANFGTLEINLTEDDAMGFMDQRMDDIKEAKTIDLKEIQRVYVAPGTWA